MWVLRSLAPKTRWSWERWTPLRRRASRHLAPAPKPPSLKATRRLPNRLCVPTVSRRPRAGHLQHFTMPSRILPAGTRQWSLKRPDWPKARGFLFAMNPPTEFWLLSRSWSTRSSAMRAIPSSLKISFWGRKRRSWRLWTGEAFTSWKAHRTINPSAKATLAPIPAAWGPIARRRL